MIFDLVSPFRNKETAHHVSGVYFIDVTKGKKPAVCRFRIAGWQPLGAFDSLPEAKDFCRRNCEDDPPTRRDTQAAERHMGQLRLEEIGISTVRGVVRNVHPLRTRGDRLAYEFEIDKQIVRTDYKDEINPHEFEGQEVSMMIQLRKVSHHDVNVVEKIL